MQRLLLIALSFTVLCSCQSNNKKEIKQTSNTLEAPPLDTSIHVPKHFYTVKIEQETAIGNIKFHINKREFNKQKQEFINKCKLQDPEFYYGGASISNKLGNYGFRGIEGEFYRDSLYKVQINGAAVLMGYYEQFALPQYYELLALLKERYGNPTSEIKVTSLIPVSQDSFYKISSWKIGDKTIEAGINFKGELCSADFYVYKPSLEIDSFLDDYHKKEAKTKKGASLL